MKNLILLLVLIVEAGCSGPVDPFLPPPPDIPISQLLAVPETTTVQGRQFNLSTMMYRDFMPMAPPGGRPLEGVVLVSALDSLPIGDLLSTDALWIVYDRKIWKSWFSHQEYPAAQFGKHQLARIFSNGPAWGPNVFVDVIVRLNDSKGETHFLRASRQMIGETD